MLYRSLADLVLLLHVAFIVFVLFGGLLAFRWRWAPMVHLPAAAWGVIVELFGLICPLTPLENALRRAGGGTGYSVDFVEQYLVPLVYPAALTYSLQLTLAAIVVVVNVVVYVAALRRLRSRAAR
jgi:Protein of Unknown function (DUF2784)